MKKFEVISNTVETLSNNVSSAIVGTYDNYDEAIKIVETIYQQNKFNPDIKDVYFDGKTLNMYNTGAGCHSTYRIIEK